MPIVTADLKSYASLNMPENDTGVSGGGIDVTTLIEFTDMAANDTVRVVSTTADTANVTVTGRNAAGAIVSEVITLNGTTPVAGSVIFERMLKIVLSAATTGNITIERNLTPFTDIVVIPAGKLAVRRMFYDSASQAGATIRFEKMFFKNEHATLTLNAASLKLTSDPSAKIRIAGSAAKGDSVSVANRLTAGPGTYVDDNVAQAVVSGTVAAGETIGVWAEMSLTGGNAAIKSTFIVELSGTTV